MLDRRTFTFGTLVALISQSAAAASGPPQLHLPQTVAAGTSLVPTYSLRRKGDEVQIDLALRNASAGPVDVLVAIGSRPGPRLNATLENGVVLEEIVDVGRRDLMSRIGPIPRYQPLAAGDSIELGTYRFTWLEDRADPVLDVTAEIQTGAGSVQLPAQRLQNGPRRQLMHPERVIDGLLHHRANELLDADGRALGEVSSPRYDPERTEVVPCPYADGRRGKPMNLSALRQLAAPWASLLATVRHLAGPAATVHRAWWVSLAGIAAPLLVDDEPVPVGLSALYKTALGLSQVSASLLLADDGVADASFASLGDPDAFFGFLDGGAWLVGQHQVCAGSAPMIRQMAEALAGGQAPDAAVLAPFADPWFADVAVVVVGLQAAYVASTYQAIRRGDGAGLAGTPGERWMQTVPPWLRAVLSVPNRPPEHIRRFFPAGSTPAPIERFLEEGPASAGALAERFAAAIRAL